MDTQALKDALKANFPGSTFTVRKGASAGASYITVTLRKSFVPVFENGAKRHTLSIYGFDDAVTSGRYNNGQRLTYAGWNLLAQVADWIRPLAGPTTFVTLNVDLQEVA